MSTATTAGLAAGLLLAPSKLKKAKRASAAAAELTAV
jgi:hypothetical protein